MAFYTKENHTDSGKIIKDLPIIDTTAFAVPGLEFSASYMPGTSSNTELHPPPWGNQSLAKVTIMVTSLGIRCCLGRWMTLGYVGNLLSLHLCSSITGI